MLITISFDCDMATIWLYLHTVCVIWNLCSCFDNDYILNWYALEMNGRVLCGTCFLSIDRDKRSLGDSVRFIPPNLNSLNAYIHIFNVAHEILRHDDDTNYCQSILASRCSRCTFRVNWIVFKYVVILISIKYLQAIIYELIEIGRLSAHSNC